MARLNWEDEEQRQSNAVFLQAKGIVLESRWRPCKLLTHLTRQGNPIPSICRRPSTDSQGTATGCDLWPGPQACTGLVLQAMAPECSVKLCLPSATSHRSCPHTARCFPGGLGPAPLQQQVRSRSTQKCPQDKLPPPPGPQIPLQCPPERPLGIPLTHLNTSSC